MSPLIPSRPSRDLTLSFQPSIRSASGRTSAAAIACSCLVRTYNSPTAGGSQAMAVASEVMISRSFPRTPPLQRRLRSTSATPGWFLAIPTATIREKSRSGVRAAPVASHPNGSSAETGGRSIGLAMSIACWSAMPFFGV